MNIIVKLTIDNQPVEVEKGVTLLEAARQLGIEIPTLCYLKDVNEIGGCRVCLVEVEGNRALLAACVTPAEEGMKVHTSTPAVIRERRKVLQLYLSNHPFDCLTCARNLNCELQTLAKRHNIREIPFKGEVNELPVDDQSAGVVREPAKCVVCRRCVTVCKDVQTVGIYDIVERGFGAVAAPAFHASLKDTPCVQCGQCIMVCPTGALHGKDDTDEVWQALADPEVFTIIQTAPSIRATLGELFGLPIGTRVTGKMVAALRRLGFDRVFDDCFGADIVVMEEGNEFIHRLHNDGPLPQLTACCPGWVNFCEWFFPEFIPHLSTVKSPQQVFGALTKTYLADKMGLDPEKIFSVSVMPCVAKKFEAQRPEMKASGQQDVDVVLTTRELAQMAKEAGIFLPKLEDEDYDDPMGYASGAGVIFGSSGGVMEATLRTVYELLTKEPLPRLELKEVRSSYWVRDAEIKVGDRLLRVAVARGLGPARRLLESVKSKEVAYDFIEIMACPGGCVGGGGQPIYSDWNKWEKQVDARSARSSALFEEDRLKKVRKSHENPAVLALYQEFLREPISEVSKKLLHTHYIKRDPHPM